jgi:uncharacterized protein (TIGR02246 family)
MTLEELLAREAIRRTINGYTAAGDARDGEAFATLFAEDAVLEFAGFGPVPGFRSEGIGDIRAHTTSWSPLPGKDPSLTLASFIRHNLTTCRIDLTGPDSATARTYFVVFTDIGPDHAGTYSDRLVRQGGDWRFAHRRIPLDWRSPDSIFPPLPR